MIIGTKIQFVLMEITCKVKSEIEMFFRVNELQTW